MSWRREAGQRGHGGALPDGRTKYLRTRQSALFIFRAHSSLPAADAHEFYFGALWPGVSTATMTPASRFLRQLCRRKTREAKGKQRRVHARGERAAAAAAAAAACAGNPTHSHGPSLAALAGAALVRTELELGSEQRHVRKRQSSPPPPKKYIIIS